MVALALGLWRIDRQDSMWRDESVTYQVAHRSLGELFGLLCHIDAVHGLYYLLMHGVFVLWDGGLVALRLPSVLATAMAAAGVGAIGARLAGRPTGVIAGLVFALLPVTQHYAQEGRSYALVTAGVTWATYMFLRGCRDPRARWWTLYGVVLGLACWLHEFAALAIVAHGLTLWRLRVSQRLWRCWGISAVGVSLCLLPLAAVSAGQADEQLGWLGRPGLTSWLQFAGISIVGWLLCRFLVRRTGRRDLAAMALPMLVAPAGLLMAVSLVKPWYVERYVLYGMTGLALPAGAALAWAVEQRHRLVPVARVLTGCLVAVATIAVLLPWSLFVRTPESRKDDAVAVAEAVARSADEGDGVLFMPARRREWLLSYPTVLGRLDDLALAESPSVSRTLQGTELPPETIRRHMLATDRIIALTDPAGQPLDPFPQEEAKRQTLKEHFEICDRTEVHGAQVLVYSRSGHCSP
ncbi:glycosyltransferase family 39 protein [Streptomyces sp. TRM70350]|uniref:glycosyltransferase family 39 protein n=1 Tax=Streptomyces sp. TRM70350 TaxID=2856165 RepID=UPI001C454886|nr:glycosyltransferase family 39 protein [Streptomyces sp. TRM70350]MBV7698452.1 glycosyltransferase family 39 protein [Streptomyces sp. TRM70350]